MAAAVCRAALAALFLVVVLQSAGAEFCDGKYCFYGCCGTFSDKCCNSWESQSTFQSSSTSTHYVYTLATGAIAGIVIGCLVFIGLIVCCIICCVRGCTRRPAPVIYAPATPYPNTTVVSNNTVNTTAMTPGTVYPYPQGQQFQMSPPYPPQGAPQQPNQYDNSAFNPGQPPPYTPTKK